MSVGTCLVFSDAFSINKAIDNLHRRDVTTLTLFNPMARVLISHNPTWCGRAVSATHSNWNRILTTAQKCLGSVRQSVTEGFCEGPSIVLSNPANGLHNQVLSNLASR